MDEWPRELRVPPPPEWMLEEQAQESKELNEALQVVEGMEEELRTNGEEASTSSTDPETAPSEMEFSVASSAAVAESALMEEDPLSRYVMPEAVTKTLEAYILVLVHPYRSNRATEWTLDCVTSLIAERYVSGRAGVRSEEAVTPEGESAPEPLSLLQRLVEASTNCADSNLEGVQTNVVKAMSAVMTSPRCGIHEASMLKAIRATFHVYLVTKSTNCKTLSKSSLLDMIRSVFSRMEAYDVMSGGSGDNPDSPHEDGIDPNLAAFSSQYHTDAYLLFRALCKLSAKPLPGEDGKNNKSVLPNFVYSGPVDPMALQSKILSLELLLALAGLQWRCVLHW